MNSESIDLLHIEVSRKSIVHATTSGVIHEQCSDKREEKKPSAEHPQCGRTCAHAHILIRVFFTRASSAQSVLVTARMRLDLLHYFNCLRRRNLPQWVN